ncbi:Translation elongation factor 1 beta [Malassezia vespertilionis]|uniref:Efb1p n=1 Tax=Malassezia vespertilionis TaxID=2020962 RepID=A0A2N1J8Z9_9BASI|nr:Translation elongation factor 1 beta [Malassezia vespertilionis]PKI83006.1 Efb1p [Malassezia vespertilionis]WFD07556.1 Translation elongation factor 1 beta [Malassezia vespertilionis]
MSLPDFSNADVLNQFNTFLADKSFVDGNEPTQADVAAFEAISSPVDAGKYPNVSRWSEHIKSYDAADLPGDKAKAAELLKFGSDDDEIDLFGSDEEEDPEAERIKAERVKEYEARKAQKPKTIQKSVVTFDVKPWDDETDMKALEEAVRGVEMDGLVWGASKLVPIGYGVSKLQITLVVEDEKVSMEELQECVQDIEDYVQSSDIAAMQKL